jgi:TetR/AcrR family transcriptional regulator, transcriptional repressor for nem operon
MTEKSKGESTKDHILKTTRHLFTTQGFRTTRISDIIEATGVKKGNLYYHFPSKEELGLAVLLDAQEEFQGFLDGSFQGNSPIDKILNSCDTLLSFLQEHDFVGGCLFGNTALEMTDSNSKFAKIIQEVFDYWTGKIEHELRAGKADGSFISPIPIASLATTVVATIEGGIMMSRVSKGKNGLADCVVILKAILIGSQEQS